MMADIPSGRCFVRQGLTLSKHCARKSFIYRVRSAEHGFTLIELLVALSIFAMLSAAGVMLLGNAVSAQGAVKQHLEQQGEMQRVIALLNQDMGQALPRITRTENGLLAPAFFSRTPSDAEPFLHFVRGGWSNMDDTSRASLQKVEYWLRHGVLERRAYPMLDGAKGNEPARLIDDVQSLSLSFRDEQGRWVDQWQSATPFNMPVAVRMDITRRGDTPLTLMFRVGMGRLYSEEERPAGQEEDSSDG